MGTGRACCCGWSESHLLWYCRCVRSLRKTTSCEQSCRPPRQRIKTWCLEVPKHQAKCPLSSVHLRKKVSTEIFIGVLKLCYLLPSPSERVDGRVAVVVLSAFKLTTPFLVGSCLMHLAVRSHFFTALGLFVLACQVDRSSFSESTKHTHGLSAV